jgi:hypothetical protein
MIQKITVETSIMSWNGNKKLKSTGNEGGKKHFVEILPSTSTEVFNIPKQEQNILEIFLDNSYRILSMEIGIQKMTLTYLNRLKQNPANLWQILL